MSCTDTIAIMIIYSLPLNLKLVVLFIMAHIQLIRNQGINLPDPAGLAGGIYCLGNVHLEQTAAMTTLKFPRTLSKPRFLVNYNK